MKFSIALLGLLVLVRAQDIADSGTSDMPPVSPDVFKDVCMPFVASKVRDILPDMLPDKLKYMLHDKIKEMIPMLPDNIKEMLSKALGGDMGGMEGPCMMPDMDHMDEKLDWEKILKPEHMPNVDWEMIESKCTMMSGMEDMSNIGHSYMFAEKMMEMIPEEARYWIGKMPDVPEWVKMKLVSKIPSSLKTCLPSLPEDVKMMLHFKMVMWLKLRIMASKVPELDMLFGPKDMPDWEAIFDNNNQPADMTSKNVSMTEFMERFKSFLPEMEEIPMRNSSIIKKWILLRLKLDMPKWVAHKILNDSLPDADRELFKSKMTMWWKMRVLMFYTHKIWRKGPQPDWEQIFSSVPGIDLLRRMVDMYHEGYMQNSTMPDYGQWPNVTMPDWDKIRNFTREQWAEKIARFFPEKQPGDPQLPEWMNERIGSRWPKWVKVAMVMDLPEPVITEVREKLKMWMYKKINSCPFDGRMFDKIKGVIEMLMKKMADRDGIDREMPGMDRDDMGVPDDWATTAEWPSAGSMEERIRRLEMLTMAESMARVKMMMDSVKGMFKMAPVMKPFIKFMLMKKLERMMMPDGPDEPDYTRSPTEEPDFSTYDPYKTTTPAWTAMPNATTTTYKTDAPINPDNTTSQPSTQPPATTQASVPSTTVKPPTLQRKFDTSGVFVVPDGVTSVDVIAIGGGGGGKNGAAKAYYGNNGGNSMFGTYVTAYGGKGAYGLGSGGQGGYATTRPGGRGGIATGESCSAGGGAAGEIGRESNLKGGFSDLPFCGAGGAPIPKNCALLDGMTWKKAASGPGGYTFFSLKAGLYGGGGASVNGGRAGGGGGYSRARVTVTPGEQIPVTVGLGGTSSGAYWGAPGVVVVAWQGDIDPLGTFTMEV